MIERVRVRHTPLPPLLAVICTVQNVGLAIGQQTAPYVCLFAAVDAGCWCCCTTVAADDDHHDSDET